MINHFPANLERTSKLGYDGSKPIFGDNVKPGMPLNEALCSISQIIDSLFGAIDFNCIDLEKLGIKCPDPDEDKRCIVLNWMADNILAINTTIATILQQLITIQTGVGVLADEKVKVRPAGVSNYLANLITAAPGAIEYQDNKIILSGTVPIGTRIYINSSRVSDFDFTGKGRILTDMWGWAIRNGQNGLDNALGLFTMATDNLPNADSIAGNANFTISKNNIQTFALPVTGMIQNALPTNVKLHIGWEHCRSFNGADGAGHPIKADNSNSSVCGNDTEAFTAPYNFEHTHGFSLNVAHTNPNPVAIPILPRHIKEIPIERIIP